jgi:outer membrane lipoprotein-sorting protein
MAMSRTAFIGTMLTALAIALPAVSTAWAQPGTPSRPKPQAAPAQTAPKPPANVGKPSGVFRPGAQTALDGDRRALVDRLSAYMSGVQTMVGDFVQVGPDGGRAKGHFYIQKPGRVRFDYQPPSPIDIIADGQSVAVRDRKLATQDVYPLSQTPLRFLLTPRIDLLRDTNIVGVYSDATFSTVVIEEHQPLVGTHRLMLMFDAKDLQLKQWIITDPQGYDTTVAIYNTDTSRRPDPSLFRINYERVLQ